MRSKRVAALVAVLSWTGATIGTPGESDLYAVKVDKIKDGVYVASRPDPLRYFVEGNVTIIVNERDVVVVDAGGAPAGSATRIRTSTKGPMSTRMRPSRPRR